MKSSSSNGSGAREGCALVTGGGRGIGAAIAEMLASAGWPVGINYSADADGAAEVAERIEASGGRALPIQADVSDAAAVDAMFEQLEEQLGNVLVLVNNAGIRHDVPVGWLDEERWQRVIGVNLSGTFHCIHRGVGKMVRSRFGRIVNISSVSAVNGLPGQSAYAASKAGVEALTRTVSTEVARRGVTINAVAPGLVLTDFVTEVTDEWADAMPSKRISEPWEVAECVRYLVSEEAAYVNGTTITIDGALTAGLGVFKRKNRAEREVKQ